MLLVQSIYLSLVRSIVCKFLVALLLFYAHLWFLSIYQSRLTMAIRHTTNDMLLFLLLLLRRYAQSSFAPAEHLVSGNSFMVLVVVVVVGFVFASQIHSCFSIFSKMFYSFSKKGKKKQQNTHLMYASSSSWFKLTVNYIDLYQ